MKLKIQSFIVFCMITSLSFAQIGIGTTNPDASSVLDMTSTTQGVLIPRMTTTQRAAITTPALGLQVYDTDSKSVWSYNGAAWTEGTGGPGKFIEGAATDIAYYDGRVGIGINAFSTAHKLFVDGPKSDDGINTAARINGTYTGTGTSTSTTAIAAVASNADSGTSNFTIANQGIVNNSTTGTIGFGVGTWQKVDNLGTMTDASGVLSAVNNYGNITRAYSLNAGVYNEDTGNVIDDARAGYLYLTNYGTMTQAHGLHIDYFGTGTVVDSYALFINERFDVGGTGDNFAIYSDADVDSYFKGNIGIGTTAPQQKVHISGAMRLEPQAIAPTGTLGDLYVGTDGNLYFNDGTPGPTGGWRQVSLVP